MLSTRTLLAVAFSLASPSLARAAEPAALLPPDAFLVAELPRGGKTVDALLASRAWRALLASDANAAFRSGPDFLRLTAGIAMLEASCGTDLASAARALLGKETAVALVPQGSGAGLVAVAAIDDAVAAESVLSGLEALASASGKGALAPPAAHARGEIRAVAPNLFRARTATHVVVGSTADLVRAALDREGGAGARRPEWMPAAPEGAAAYDLEIAYRPAAAPKKIPERLADLGQALLFGGFAEALRGADVATASFDVDASGAGPAIVVRVPGVAAGAFFPETSAGSRRDLPHPPRSLGAIRIRRDLASLWDVRETLLDAKAISGLAQFAGFMAILFSGKDFGEDVLPKFLPDVEIVAARAEFAPGEPKPKVPVPAFGAIFRLRDAAGFGPFLEVAFQTALGVVNADRGQKGMMPMLIRTETHRGASVVSGRFVASSSGDPEDAQWNYSPAAAIAGDRFILASSAAFCRDLVDDATVSIPLSQGGSGAVQDQVVVDGGSVHAYLAGIEEAMVAQNRLEKGNDEAAARREVSALLSLVRLVERLEIVTRVDGTGLRADAWLSLVPPAAERKAGAR